MKRELAALCISKPWERADQASVSGNASALAVFAKLGREMAASLSPQDWGEKVQVDSRQLVVVTNLDFGEAGEGIMSFEEARALGIVEPENCARTAHPEARNLPATREY